MTMAVAMSMPIMGYYLYLPTLDEEVEECDLIAVRAEVDFRVRDHCAPPDQNVRLVLEGWGDLQGYSGQ